MKKLTGHRKLKLLTKEARTILLEIRAFSKPRLSRLYKIGEQMNKTGEGAFWNPPQEILTECAELAFYGQPGNPEEWTAGNFHDLISAQERQKDYEEWETREL